MTEMDTDQVISCIILPHNIQYHHAGRGDQRGGAGHRLHEVRAAHHHHGQQDHGQVHLS